VFRYSESDMRSMFSARKSEELIVTIPLVPGEPRNPYRSVAGHRDPFGIWCSMVHRNASSVNLGQHSVWICLASIQSTVIPILFGGYRYLDIFEIRPSIRFPVLTIRNHILESSTRFRYCLPDLVTWTSFGIRPHIRFLVLTTRKHILESSTRCD
jgi:hypothetical protein